MKFALLLYDDEAAWDELDEAEQAAAFEGYAALDTEHGAIIRGGEALTPVATATTVRVRDGERLLTDGPFAETREQLGGFYVIDVPGLDEALAFAAKIPGATTGSVEVRPVLVFDAPEAEA